MKTDNKILNISKVFALKIVKLYQFLTDDKKEYVMSKQLLKAGTSIGANVTEATRGQSKADFYAKMKIADKEAGETEYWLGLLHDAEYIDDATYTEYQLLINEIVNVLTAICRTTKENVSK